MCRQKKKGQKLLLHQKIKKHALDEPEQTRAHAGLLVRGVGGGLWRRGVSQHWPGRAGAGEYGVHPPVCCRPAARAP
jgi:hypothetical protein